MEAGCPRGHRGTAQAFCIGLILLAASTFVAQTAAPGAEPAVVSPFPVAPPRKLAQAVSAEVERDEKEIADALAHPEQLDPIRQAIPKAEHVLQIRKTQQGEDWWETADAANNLTKLRRILSLSESDRTALARAWNQNNQVMDLFNARKFDEAAKILMARAEIERRTLGEESPDYALTLNMLSSLTGMEGHFDQAEQLDQQSLAIQKKVEGEQHPDYAKGLQILATIYAVTGRREQAEPLLRQALAIRRQAFGEQDPRLTASLALLAELEKQLGRYRDAESFLRQAADIQRQIGGDRDPQYADSLNKLGMLYGEMGRYREAEPLFRQILEIRRSTLGPEHSDYAISLNNMAWLYSEMNRLTEAETLYRESAAILKKKPGETSPEYAQSLANIADLDVAMGRFPQAEALYQQAGDIFRRVAGEQNMFYAGVLRGEAGLAVERGRYADAQQLYRQSWDTCKKILSEQHSTCAALTIYLGDTYQKMGNYKEAEPIYVQAAEHIKTQVGEQSAQYAECLSRLAVLYASLGRYRESEALSVKSNGILRQALGDDHPKYAGGLSNLASLYLDQGRYSEAENLFHQTQEILKKAVSEDNMLYVTALNNLGILYTATGSYGHAEAQFRQAADVLSRGDKDPSAYATSLVNLANLYVAMGRYDRAEPLSQQALEILKKDFGEAQPSYAKALNIIAMLDFRLGRLDDAEHVWKQSLDVLTKTVGEEHPDYAVALVNLGVFYTSRKRYDQAEPLLRRAVDSLKKSVSKESPQYSTALNDLAEVYIGTGRYAEAEPLLRQCLEIDENSLGNQHPQYANRLVNLGGLYAKTNRAAQAEPLLRQAVAITRKAEGESHPNYALALSNLATTLAMLKHQDEASSLLLQSLQAQWENLTQNFPVMSSQQKRQFFDQAGFSQNDLIWGLIFQGGGPHPDVGLQAALLSKQLLFEAARQESGALASTVATASPAWQEQWHRREQLRRQFAAIALQTMAKADRTPEAQSKPADSSLVATVAGQIETLEEQLRRGNPAYNQQALLQKVEVADVRRSLLPGQALIEYIDYDPYDFATGTWKDRRYGTLVLLGGSGKVLAVDLGAETAVDEAVRHLRTKVRDSIDRFKSMQPSPHQIRVSEDEIGIASSALRKLVWQPLETHLVGIKRVYVAPDGLLSLIPFECLARRASSGAWRYLAEDRELVYLGTGRDLGRLALTAHVDDRRPKTAVLIGNPAFDALPAQLASVVAGLQPAPGPKRLASANLPGATSTLGGTVSAGAVRLQVPHEWPQVAVLGEMVERAGTQLKRLGWSVTTLEGRAAVEEAAEAVQAPRILQFATHGYVLDRPASGVAGWDNPLLRSMLLLAGANRWEPQQSVFYHLGRQVLTESEVRARGLSEQQLEASRLHLSDGILTAYEVTGMNLQGTELVNLTACETGLGEVTPDGVVGLRQAFLLAGARALTMSMWEVPADQTAQQISQFYDNWLGGEGKRPASRYEAFRAAQLTALARARQNEGAGHPFFWAGIVYVGDPGDLPPAVSVTAPAAWR